MTRDRVRCPFCGQWVRELRYHERIICLAYIAAREITKPHVKPSIGRPTTAVRIVSASSDNRRESDPQSVRDGCEVRGAGRPYWVWEDLDRRSRASNAKGGDGRVCVQRE